MAESNNLLVRALNGFLFSGLDKDNWIHFEFSIMTKQCNVTFQPHDSESFNLFSNLVTAAPPDANSDPLAPSSGLKSNTLLFF